VQDSMPTPEPQPDPDAALQPHTSVLLDVVLDALQPLGGVGFRALDCTLGAGGHAAGLLERSAPDGQLVGLDADPAALALARARLAPFGDRVTLLQRNFGDLGDLELEPVSAIVFDLGLSSMQLDSSARGFSFRQDEPLDMRFDPTRDQPTAAELVNTLSETELERVLRDYGEEPRARRVAREVARRRPMQRTGELVAAVTAALGPARGRINPATRTFQALRIAVNDELGALERGLDAGVQLLRPGGRMAVISFHSLEDRIVKWRFRGWADQGMVRVLTRKPTQPSTDEAARNPRARSAKLRVAERAWR
jgi:16S rRNA (cytosine1402-N4)-methyltransferase